MEELNEKELMVVDGGSCNCSGCNCSAREYDRRLFSPEFGKAL